MRKFWKHQEVGVFFVNLLEQEKSHHVNVIKKRLKSIAATPNILSVKGLVPSAYDPTIFEYHIDDAELQKLDPGEAYKISLSFDDACLYIHEIEVVFNAPTFEL